MHHNYGILPSINFVHAEEAKRKPCYYLICMRLDDLRDTVAGGSVALGMVCRLLLPPSHVTTFLYKYGYRYCVTNTSTGKSRGFNQITVVHYCTAWELLHTSYFRDGRNIQLTRNKDPFAVLRTYKKNSFNLVFKNCRNNINPTVN